MDNYLFPAPLVWVELSACGCRGGIAQTHQDCIKRWVSLRAKEPRCQSIHPTQKGKLIIHHNLEVEEGGSSDLNSPYSKVYTGWILKSTYFVKASKVSEALSAVLSTLSEIALLVDSTLSVTVLVTSFVVA